MVPSRRWWAFAWIATGFIAFALATQVVTLSWRNWIQMTFVNAHNATADHLQIGLWGACAQNEGCYAFHGDKVPWHLQVGVFLAMGLICGETMLLCLCFVELLYLWHAREKFPLKKTQLYLSLVCGVMSLLMAGIIALMVVGGFEQEMWTTLHYKWLKSESVDLDRASRFSVSQAWGYQILITAYLCCYTLTVRFQMVDARNALSSVRNGLPTSRRARIEIAVVTPGDPQTHTLIQRTPPPAYSPPPAYPVEEQETNFIEVPLLPGPDVETQAANGAHTLTFYL